MSQTTSSVPAYDKLRFFVHSSHSFSFPNAVDLSSHLSGNTQFVPPPNNTCDHRLTNANKKSRVLIILSFSSIRLLNPTTPPPIDYLQLPPPRSPCLRRESENGESATLVHTIGIHFHTQATTKIHSLWILWPPRQTAVVPIFMIGGLPVSHGLNRGDKHPLAFWHHLLRSILGLLVPQKKKKKKKHSLPETNDATPISPVNRPHFEKRRGPKMPPMHQIPVMNAGNDIESTVWVVCLTR